MTGAPGPERFIGTVLAGRYEVTGVLGAGGMGVVLEARQIAVDRQVAVKLLHASFGANRHAVARFIREMQVTSRLEHPSTVRVYDFGEASIEGEGTQLFLVMELVHGRTLGKLLAQGPLGHRRIVAIALQVARALEAAHGEGIVHRDLKPDNVMISDRYGSADVVKVLDFGIARFVDGAEGEGVGKLTAEGAVIGTPAYMSPEQATGAPLGPASDLYSLGVMLFEMATGSVPFSAPTTVSLMVKHVQERPPRPSDLVPVPAPLDALILKCLEKTPALRPASAKDLANQLEAIGRELDTPGAARVLRGEGARFEAQKAGALAADTAKTHGPPAAMTDASELPAKSGLPLAWVAVGVGVIAGLVLAIVMLSSDPSVPAKQDATIVPAATIALADAAFAPDDVALAPELIEAQAIVRTDMSVEPPVPRGCPNELIEAALDAIGKRAPDTAARAQAALDACPRWAKGYVIKGQVEIAEGSPDAGLASFRKAAALAPDWGVPRFDVALALISTDQPAPAKAELEALLAKAPDWPTAWLLLAQAELKLHNPRAAETAARREIAVEPEAAEGWLLLALALKARGADAPAGEAKAAFCKAADLGNKDAATLCRVTP